VFEGVIILFCNEKGISLLLLISEMSARALQAMEYPIGTKTVALLGSEVGPVIPFVVSSAPVTSDEKNVEAVGCQQKIHVRAQVSYN
jgi:hypothetical protein